MINTQKDVSSNPEVNKWFSEMIEHLEVDRFMMGENLVSDDTKGFYESLIYGDITSITQTLRGTSSKFFVSKMLKAYIHELSSRRIPVQKLGFDYSDAHIYVWIQVADDDENSIDNLTLAEAKVNSDFFQHGYNITSMIFEESDNMAIPEHYIVPQKS